MELGDLRGTRPQRISGHLTQGSSGTGCGPTATPVQGPRAVPRKQAEDGWGWGCRLLGEGGSGFVQGGGAVGPVD